MGEVSDNLYIIVLLILLFSFYENEMPQSETDHRFNKINCLLHELATEYRGPIITKRAINDIYVEAPDNSDLVDPVTYTGTFF
jgi:hypothetical protein